MYGRECAAFVVLRKDIDRRSSNSVGRKMACAGGGNILENQRDHEAAILTFFLPTRRSFHAVHRRTTVYRAFIHICSGAKLLVLHVINPLAVAVDVTLTACLVFWRKNYRSAILDFCNNIDP
jgi:hypothetical protein